MHTSSPAARNSKDWTKQLTATEYILDLWSEKKFGSLPYVRVI